LLSNAVVKVVIPTERSLLCLIHRMIEFVVREGPMFEAMIMNREINNPMFRFLFDNQSPAHVYYRWRLYSILKGDHPSKWHTEEFYMFKNGSQWKPPPLNPYLQGMPEELVELPTPRPMEPKKGSLSDSQRDKFEDLLRHITPEKYKIAETMIYCIDHAEAAEEIIECVGEAIAIPEAPLYKKIARLYLISDILHNCSVKVANASYFRKGFQNKLPDIFKDLNEIFHSIEGRLRAEQFKQRVVSCFRAWEDWAIYPSEFLIKLQNLFLGLIPLSREANEDSNSYQATQVPIPDAELPSGDDIDGVPLSSDDIDGVPLDVPLSEDRDDIDGVPLNDDLDGQPLEEPVPQETNDISSKFKPSKWETVDPETVEAQAITTSKWDLLEQNEDQEQVDDIDGQPMDDTASTQDELSLQDDDNSKDSTTVIEQFKTDINEQRRAKLREIEMKVMKYQDELESGKRSRKQCMKFSDQVEHYRQKLLKKVERDTKLERDGSDRSHKRHKSHSSSPVIRAHSPSSEEGDHSQSPNYYSASRKISPRSVAMSISDNLHSPHKSYRSHSPKKVRRSRSRSPKRSRRSRSKSPYKRRLSPESPPMRKHKSKKSRH
ncbi:hypothetical protein NPIL_585381, partial [Nephila pilipes]